MPQMRFWGRLVPIALLSGAAAAASAQYNTPAPRQDIPQNDMPAEQQQQQQAAPASRAEVLRAAACVVGRDPAPAEALLATAPFSGDERDKAVRLLRSAERCLRQRQPLVTSAPVLRGAVAETLYEARFAQPAAARTPAAPAAPVLRPADIAARDDAGFLTTSWGLAHCAAPQHADQVRALLASETGTDAELTALQALYPAFTACVAAGTQLRVDRGGIRAMLAETLYRWSVVQRDGPASPWAAPAATAAAPTQ
jgi:hypothetical protein